MALLNSLWVLGILFIIFCVIGVQAQDRSRSRYIPPADDESLPEEKEFKPPRTSRRIQAPVQRTRPAKEPLNSDIDHDKDAWRAPSSGRRIPNIEDRLPNTRTESHRQPISAPSYQSDPQSQYEGRIRDGLPETSATPPPSREEEKKKRPKKRRRPKPTLVLDESEDLPNPIGNDSKKPPESLILENEREYSSFRNPSLQAENIPSRESSLPHNPSSVDTRTRSQPVVNIRSRGSPPESTRNRNIPSESTRSRGAPQESIRNPNPSLENTRSRSSQVENSRTRNPPLENTRNRNPPSENIRSRSPSSDNIRSRNPPLENTNSRTSISDPVRENGESRSSRRHSFRPQPAHNRLPLQDDDTPSNIGTQDDRNKNSQIIPESDFPSEHINPNSQASPYNRNFDSLNSPVGAGPYQPTNEDRLPGHERLPEHESNIHLPPPGQPFDVSGFEQPGVDYSDLPQEPEPKLLNPISHNDAGQIPAKFPIPSNRLTNPIEVNYKPPEAVEHPTFSHSNNDQQSELKNRQLPPDSAIRITSDRLPTAPQSHSRQQQNPAEHRGQIGSSPRYTAAAQSRVGSTYQPENQDNRNSGLQRGNPNRSGPDPKLQNVASRYLQSHRNNEDRAAVEERAAPARVRSEVPLQRAGSRYQADNLDVDDYNPSREPQQPPEDVPEIKPARQRTVPRSQRTRSRYQPEPVDDPAPEEPLRRVPEPKIQRTRSRYQPQSDNQPNSPSQGDHLRSQNEQVDTPRRDRTRSRYQESLQGRPSPVRNIPEEKNPPPPPPPRVHHRSKPQFDSNNPHNAYSEDTQPDYVSDYQNVQRAPQQRRPSPERAVQQPQAAPRQRSTHRQSQPAPPSRQANSEPADRPNKSNFRCPHPNGFFPDEQQCDKYYECRDGIAEEGLCSDGLVFNLISAPTHVRCDSLRDVDCNSRPKLQEPQSTKNCPRRFGLFPHKTICTKFWQCVDGSGTEIQCPPGLVYDDSKGTCNWADLVKDSCATEDLLGFTCPEATGAQLLDGVYVRYAHPENCQLHYTCIKGADGERRPRLLSCNEGLVYDPETSQCARPENVPGCEEFYGKPVARTPARQQPREPPPEEEQPPPRTSSRRRRPNQQRTRS